LVITGWLLVIRVAFGDMGGFGRLLGKTAIMQVFLPKTGDLIRKPAKLKEFSPYRTKTAFFEKNSCILAGI